jgi:hypothetical protein
MTSNQEMIFQRARHQLPAIQGREGHPWKVWGRGLWSGVVAYWTRIWPGGQLGRYLLLVVVSGLAVLLYAVSQWPSRDVALLSFLMILSALAEAVPIPLLGTSLQGSTLSVASAMSFAGLLLLGLPGAVLVNCGSAVVNGFYPKRRPPYKFAFNAASFLLSAAAAGALYQLMGGVVPVASSFHNLIVASLAAVTYFLVNTGLVSRAISLATNRSWRELWGNWQWLAVQYMTCFAIAMAMAMAQKILGTLGFMILTLPLALPWYSIKLYARKTKEIAEHNERLASINQVLDWRVQELQTLHQISLGLNQSQSLLGILNEIVHAVSDLIDASGSAVLLYEPDHETLRVGGHIGFSSEYIAEAQPAFNGSAARALREGRPLVVSEQGLATEMLSAAAIREGVQAAACLPLKVDGRIVGGLDVCFKSAHSFTEDELDILSILAQQAAVAIHKAQLLDQVHHSYLNTIQALAATVEAKDPYTRGHSERVCRLAVAMGQEMGLDERRLQLLNLAALLHDIGKIGVPESILCKPMSLTVEEMLLVRQHPVWAEPILRHVPDMPELVTVVRHHHERYDGQGYPDSVSSRAHPLSAIICVADAYDAMTSDRPYRAALSHHAALEEVRRQAGTQFAPQVVEAFVEVMAEQPTVLSLKDYRVRPAAAGTPMLAQPAVQNVVAVEVQRLLRVSQ